ncbi:hypothetical protein Droror1_Dr00026369 [Drosera rotundifolia]
MADALRKLRVEELKREVQRRDASIVSLELKVKRLEEEREKTSKTMVDDVEGGADLIILESVLFRDLDIDLRQGLATAAAQHSSVQGCCL